MFKIGQFVLVYCPYGSGYMVGKIIKIGPSYFTFPSAPKIEIYFTKYDQSFLYTQDNVIILPRVCQILFE